jgi:Flp pilus assembly pilin Flp
MLRQVPYAASSLRTTLKTFFARMWRETDGVLSFEWTVLTSVLTIGAVAGIAAVRDAVQDEMADVAEAMTSLDQSYQIQGPLIISVHTAYTGGSGRTRVQEFRRSTPAPMTPERMGSTGAAGSAYHDERSQVVRRPQAPLPGPEATGALLDSDVDSES